MDRRSKKNLLQYVETLKAQRDALLEACKAAEAVLPNGPFDVTTKVKAAIAKCGGPELIDFSKRTG